MTRERGFALITVVLLMIGLAVLATGLVFSASQHAAVVASMHDLARARRGAEVAVAIALREWNAATRSRDPLATDVALVHAVDLEPGLRVAAGARRLNGGTFLVTGTAAAGRGALEPIRQSAARLVRSANIDSLGRAFDAALITDRAVLGAGARVTGAAGGAAAPVAARDSAAAELCASWGLAGGALRVPADSLTVRGGAAVDGNPPIVPDSDVARFRADPGPLDLALLRAAAATIRSPTVSPAPFERADACDTNAPGNWGAPSGPCDSLRVLVHAPDRLEILGGYGQGILLADDELVLDGGFRFAGIIIARGTVTVRDAAVQGVVIAPRVELESGSASLDRCALADALVGVSALRAARLPARSWLPTFD